MDLKAADLNSAEWNNAQRVQIDRYWSGAPAPANRHAEARMLWSTKALHVRFVCHQAEPLVVSEKPQTLTKTMGLWDRDVCEIFIAPDPHVIERYLEFEAAPTGEWLDVAIHWTAEKRESDWQFNSHLTASRSPCAFPGIIGFTSRKRASAGALICFAASAKIPIAVISPGDQRARRNQTSTYLRCLGGCASSRRKVASLARRDALTLTLSHWGRRDRSIAR